MAKKFKRLTNIDRKPYQGIFKPTNPKKYKGKINNIVYRSSWEKKFMLYCDRTPGVVEWGSEEIVIPYRSLGGSIVRRYFPDFYMKTKQKNGTFQKFLVEIKPKYQTKKPKLLKRKTSKYYKQLHTYLKNESKWKTAQAWCRKHGMKFVILTEDHLKTF